MFGPSKTDKTQRKNTNVKSMLLVVKMRPQFFLRNISRRLHEDRSQQSFSNRIMICDGQRLNAGWLNSSHFDVLRPTNDFKAERLENPNYFPAAENLKTSPHTLTEAPQSSSGWTARARIRARPDRHRGNKWRQRPGRSRKAPRTSSPRSQLERPQRRRRTCRPRATP